MTGTGPPEFAASLGLLAVLSAIAVLALVVDANWPKALQVGLASATYVVILAASGLAFGRAKAGPVLPPVRVFVLAGGVAGFESGIVRPEVTMRLVLVQTLAAALLLGGFHWLAARSWRRIHGWIAASPLRREEPGQQSPDPLHLPPSNR